MIAKSVNATNRSDANDCATHEFEEIRGSTRGRPEMTLHRNPLSGRLPCAGSIDDRERQEKPQSGIGCRLSGAGVVGPPIPASVNPRKTITAAVPNHLGNHLGWIPNRWGNRNSSNSRGIRGSCAPLRLLAWRCTPDLLDLSAAARGETPGSRRAMEIGIGSEAKATLGCSNRSRPCSPGRRLDRPSRRSPMRGERRVGAPGNTYAKH